MKESKGREGTRATPTLERCDSQQFGCWQERMLDLEELAGPLVRSGAFVRLGQITFLGILSPRFAHETNSPLYSKIRRHLVCDGSRYSHSLGVALLGLDIARALGLSESAQRYVVAWGLLHDISNWPLSHTGEFAFARITRVSRRALRRMMICGDRRVPSNFRLDSSLHAAQLDPNLLVALFDKKVDNLSPDLRKFVALLNSALSPDTLEGMWRSGMVFDVDVPHPSEFTQAFLRNLFDNVAVDSAFAKRVVSFWRQTAVIYRQFINRPTVVEWESAWSRGILREWHDVSLAESLTLNEDQIIAGVLAAGLERSGQLSRYKAPLEYRVEPPLRRSLPSNVELEELRQILTRRPMSSL